EEHELGFPVAPHHRAQPAPRFDLHRFASDGGRTVVRESELLGVLVEQGELVVRNPFHARSSDVGSSTLAFRVDEPHPGGTRSRGPKCPTARFPTTGSSPTRRSTTG